NVERRTIKRDPSGAAFRANTHCFAAVRFCACRLTEVVFHFIFASLIQSSWSCRPMKQAHGDFTWSKHCADQPRALRQVLRRWAQASPLHFPPRAEASRYLSERLRA